MLLLLVFLAVPLIEIALFIKVGGAVGLWWTLAIVVLTAVLGTRLIRAQGQSALNDLRTSFDELRDPTEPLAHGAMILFSGALLLTPGFFTDAVGFALLFPPVRLAIMSYLRSRVKVAEFSVSSSTVHTADPTEIVIEGEFEEIDPNSDAPKQDRTGH